MSHWLTIAYQNQAPNPHETKGQTMVRMSLYNRAANQGQFDLENRIHIKIPDFLIFASG
jgi:hypothetical protein